MDYFQAKIGWEWSKKRENKKIVPMSSSPTRDREFQKNSIKIQKIKKHHYDFFSSENKLGNAEKEWKKKRGPMSS